jgi:hypothetical protein
MKTSLFEYQRPCRAARPSPAHRDRGALPILTDRTEYAAVMFAAVDLHLDHIGVAVSASSEKGGVNPSPAELLASLSRHEAKATAFGNAARGVVATHRIMPWHMVGALPNRR